MNPQAQDWTRFWKRQESRRFGRISWSKRRILDVLNPYVVGGRAALDAGCGSGFFSGHFVRKGMETTALDYSPRALELAAESTEGKARLVRADLLQDDLSGVLPGTYDLIFSDGLLEHFTAGQQDRILRNLMSVCSDEGVIVTVVPNRWSPWELIRPLYMPGIEETPFVLTELIGLNESNGLEVLRRGGLNVLPFALSPERWLGSRFGMLLFTVAAPVSDGEDA